jgi:hypothetical protein
MFVPKSSTCASRSEDSKEILQLQRAISAELLLGRMHAKINDLCFERERQKEEQGGPTRARAWQPELVMAEPLQWYDEKADNSRWIKGLDEVRHRPKREGWY